MFTIHYRYIYRPINMYIMCVQLINLQNYSIINSIYFTVNMEIRQPITLTGASVSRLKCIILKKKTSSRGHRFRIP